MNELIIREDGKFKKYEDLLLKRDQLYKEAGSIYSVYMETFGDLLLQDFEIKVECIKKRKMIAYCLQAVNHGETIDVAQMNEMISHEMAIYEQQLNQMALDKAEADKQKKSPVYKVERAKRIYRRLAKLIHPDINPAAASIKEISELWERIVIAYHCNDDSELDNLEILVRKVLRDNGELISGANIDNVDERIARLEEEINTILTTEPYIYYELLLSPERTAERKEELNRAIDENRKFSEDLSMILRDIIAGGGVPLTWIQD